MTTIGATLLMAILALFPGKALLFFEYSQDQYRHEYSWPRWWRSFQDCLFITVSSATIVAVVVWSRAFAIFSFKSGIGKISVF